MEKGYSDVETAAAAGALLATWQIIDDVVTSVALNFSSLSGRSNHRFVT